MRRKACFIILLITLSLIGHSYIIFRFHHDGVLSTGPNDGMEQMILFKCIFIINGLKGTYFIQHIWVLAEIFH